jgi:hypothetical protein
MAGEKPFKGTDQLCFKIIWNHQSIHSRKKKGSSVFFFMDRDPFWENLYIGISASPV